MNAVVDVSIKVKLLLTVVLAMLLSVLLSFYQYAEAHTYGYRTFQVTRTEQCGIGNLGRQTVYYQVTEEYGPSGSPGETATNHRHTKYQTFRETGRSRCLPSTRYDDVTKPNDANELNNHEFHRLPK